MLLNRRLDLRSAVCLRPRADVVSQIVHRVVAHLDHVAVRVRLPSVALELLDHHRAGLEHKQPRLAPRPGLLVVRLPELQILLDALYAAPPLLRLLDQILCAARGGYHTAPEQLYGS